MKRSLVVFGFMVILLGACMQEKHSIRDLDHIFVRVETKEESVQYTPLASTAIEYFPENRYVDKPTPRFYYETLSQSEKELYHQIYSGVTNLEPEIYVSSYDTNEVETVFRSVMYDSPEIFYISGYDCVKHTRKDEIISISLQIKYDFDFQEIEEIQDQVDCYLTECIARMPQETSDYEKVLYVYNYIVKNTEYNLEAENNQNICSVFVAGESVCQGYTKAAQYILNRMGIETTIVYGVVNNNEPHVWNLLKLEDDYYYMDLTWGENRFGGMKDEELSQAKELFPISYEYFLITTKELKKTHKIVSQVELPNCDSKKYNYYVQTGTYLADTDTEQLEGIFRQAYRGNQRVVSIKCDSKEAFDKMKTFLIKEKHIFDYVSKEDKIAFVDNENLNTMSIWLE